MKPILVVLAAGIGSRYGGLKQIDPVGPTGQIILDYSIYDAARAGFGKVVFVIRKDIEEDFKNHIGQRYDRHMPVEYCFQEMDMLPDDMQAPVDRTQPWGTGHATLVSKDNIDAPFAVINADDFYGQSAYAEMAGFLSRAEAESPVPTYAMVGYLLKNTVSEHGSVSRGLCELAPDGTLASVTERIRIEKKEEGIFFLDEQDRSHELNPDDIVSMNFWGFTPEIFPALEIEFNKFLSTADQEKGEFHLPGALDQFIKTKQAKVAVLPCHDRWVGITYMEDKQSVRLHLKELTEKGVYPETLW